MKSKSLNGTWTLYYAESGKYEIENYSDFDKYDIPSINATVPGNVELDLSKAGLLPEDLFMGNTLIGEVRKIETWEWWYKTEFSKDDLDGNNVFLNFEAVDCYAEYYLNGEKIGESDNALIAHKFDVKGKLQDNNTLIVHIRSTFLEEYKFDTPAMFMMQSTPDHPANQVVSRRPPHSYNWDIMPRAISAGIWRGVTLENHDEYEIEDIYFVEKYFYTGHVELHANVVTNLPPKEFAYPKKYPTITIKASCRDSEFSGSTVMAFKNCGVSGGTKNPYLWWPKNYGNPDMYDVTVTVTDSDDGHVLCEKTVKHGFRKVELLRADTTSDGDGRFAFKINDVEIYCQGTNWVPMSPYHSMDADRYKAALDLIDDCGCNIIRCWGGNVYEDTYFYDYCDEHGIMVWQDFTMACNFYPQEEWFYEKMRKEAKSVVKKFRNHPSLVLWAGDNENDQGLDATRINPNFNKITRVVLREVVEALCPTVPYLASSPFYSEKAFNDVTKEDFSKSYEVLPEVHVWGSRDYYKAPFYTKQTASFISESGYHGSPSAESLKKFINPDKLYPNTNEEWYFHSTHNMLANSRISMMNKQIIQLVGFLPDNLDDFVVISQFSQAEAKKFFVERMRIRRPHSSGIIWWNMLDGWPQVSDAVVDFYYDKKLAYYWIKKSQQPFCIMLNEINSWGCAIVASNCTLENKSGTYKVYDAETGETVAGGKFSLEANKNAAEIGKVPVFYCDQKLFIIEWTLDDGTKGTNHYVSGFPKFDFDTIKNKWIPKIKELCK